MECPEQATEVFGSLTSNTGSYDPDNITIRITGVNNRSEQQNPHQRPLQTGCIYFIEDHGYQLANTAGNIKQTRVDSQDEDIRQTEVPTNEDIGTTGVARSGPRCREIV